MTLRLTRQLAVKVSDRWHNRLPESNNTKTECGESPASRGDCYQLNSIDLHAPKAMTHSPLLQNNKKTHLACFKGHFPHFITASTSEFQAKKAI
ncbi:hypothetical protein GCM10011520_20860 [Shewanella carassii]|uniref:Uncharacterized protein n=1 Tax=Shewanella carassii TaxID=1987584 RepID=A0ABQ1T412_9GAMM|nr:hypothetical protein GCM10011520_20860 [Shewanella carassii]